MDDGGYSPPPGYPSPYPAYPSAAEVQRLQQQLDLLQQALYTASDAKSSAEQQVNTLTKQLAQANAEVIQLHADLDAAQATVAQLQKEAQQARETRATSASFNFAIWEQLVKGVFISYSHQDNAWCLEFTNALKDLSLNIWYDEGIYKGSNWVTTIEKELESRAIFLVVLTPESVESEWVKSEFTLAQAARKRILPLLLKDCTITGFLRTFQYFDVRDKAPQAAARDTFLHLLQQA